MNHHSIGCASGKSAPPETCSSRARAACPPEGQGAGDGDTGPGHRASAGPIWASPSNAALRVSDGRETTRLHGPGYIIPMPPPGPAPAAAGASFFSGLSATVASVVKQKAATEAAFCKRRTGDFGGVDDACLEQVLELAGHGVEADPAFFALGPAGSTTAPSRPALEAIQRIGSSRALLTIVAPVASSPSRRLGQLVDRGPAAQQRQASAGHDAFLDGGFGGRNSVLDAVLLFLQLDLGRRADPDNGDAAGQLGQALLQLLTVPVGIRVFDLALDLGNASLDVAARNRLLR